MDRNHLKKQNSLACGAKATEPSCLRYSITLDDKKKVNKGAWRMPWVLEAKKDVISCDKLRGLANTI
jgi:hypothetical protein